MTRSKRACLSSNPPILPYVIRTSKVHGNGLFAIREIPVGLRLIEYKGKRISREELLRSDFSSSTNHYHTFYFSMPDGHVIDAGVDGNESRWINHSCEPNCITREENGHIFIDTLRPIQCGEELSYDYRLSLTCWYTPALKRAYACRCGAIACRKTMLIPTTKVSVRQRDLFFAFMRIGISCFGNALSSAHRLLVARKKWLSEKEFAKAVKLRQIIPGTNIINLAITVGVHLRGNWGAVLTICGLIVVPIAIVLILGALQRYFDGINWVHLTIGGVATGLVIPMALKAAGAETPRWWRIAIGALTFVSIGLLHFSLIPILVALAVFGISSPQRDMK
ncbi:MAG: chromate transporter [Pseudomonadota bacterium]